MEFKHGQPVKSDTSVVFGNAEVVYRLVEVIDEEKRHEKSYGNWKKKVSAIRESYKLYPGRVKWDENPHVGKRGCLEARFTYEGQIKLLRIYEEVVRE